MWESSRRPWLPLLLLLLALLLLIVDEAGYLTPVENVFHYVLDPLQRVLSGVTRFTGALFQGRQDVQELRAEVESLRAQVDALTLENVRLREYEAEVLQLRAMLNFVSPYPISAPLGADVIGKGACETFPCAEVVAGETNPYLSYITINVGAQQGVAVGMPVISGGAGLIGRVAEVAPRTAKVQLINDRESSVAALLQSSRTTGLVVGQPDGSLRMEYLPQGAVVTEGDIVLTSGLGGAMPKGLVIGQIAEIEQMDYALFQAAVVRPVLDFSRLEQVLVITTFEQIPLDEPIPADEVPGEPTPTAP
jgi:rod shape-determining protein MreC